MDPKDTVRNLPTPPSLKSENKQVRHRHSEEEWPSINYTLDLGPVLEGC